jgi:hypothetical protein
MGSEVWEGETNEERCRGWRRETVKEGYEDSIEEMEEDEGISKERKRKIKMEQQK